MTTLTSTASGRDYLQQLWQLRYFLCSLVKKDLMARYRRSSLGIGWSMVRPLAMCIVLCLVFSKIFNVSIQEYAPFLLLGITVWQFLVESSTLGCNTFILAGHYLRQRPMPLALFPMRTVMGVGFHAGIALLLAILLTWIFRGFYPSALLSLIPSVVLLLIFGWSIAVLAGVSQCYFPDTQHLLEIALQMLFYLTPVLYPVEAIASRGRFTTLILWNPLTHVMEIVRTPLLTGNLASAESYAIAAGTVLGTALVAMACLFRIGRKLIFWI